MILIIGGAYQGKLDYAKKEYGVKDEEVFECQETSTAVGFDEKIINHFEKYVLAVRKAGQDPERALKMQIPAGRYKDKIVIADDISQGIVPTDEVERAWREDVGRCLVLLGKEAEKIERVFAGVAETVKPGDADTAI